MSKLFFTSDHHFGHKNILKFSNRPFTNVQEMDEIMIQKWNEKVQPEDEVYHLGDFGLSSSGKIEKNIRTSQRKNISNQWQSRKICSGLPYQIRMD